MRVALQAVLLAPRHEQQLGVRLQADDAVHDLRADRLEPLGPVDVGLLLEARLQLDDRHHFLAAPRRLDQQVHQRRDAAGAVDRLLDRQHVGVVDRLAQEADDRLERLERLVQEQRAAPHAVEHRLRSLQRRRRRRLERREAQRRRVGEVDQLVHAHQVDRAVDAVERKLGRGRTAGAGTARARAGRCRRPRAAPPRRSGASSGPMRSAWRRLVTSASTSRSESRVMRNCENASTSRPGKERAEVGADHARQQHERLALPAARRGSSITRGRTRGTLTIVAVLRRPNASLPARRAMKLSDLLATCGNGMRRVEADRHQQRPHLGLEEGADPASLGAVAVGVVEDADAALGERRHHLVVEDRVLLVEERVRAAASASMSAGGRAAVGPPRRLEAVGEADLEELVEVRRDDADVAQPLEQRHVVAARLRQDAPVELEDRALAVQQRRHRHGGRGDGGSHPSSVGASCDSFVTRPIRPRHRGRHGRRGRRRGAASRAPRRPGPRRRASERPCSSARRRAATGCR